MMNGILMNFQRWNEIYYTSLIFRLNLQRILLIRLKLISYIILSLLCLYWIDLTIIKNISFIILKLYFQMFFKQTLIRTNWDKKKSYILYIIKCLKQKIPFAIYQLLLITLLTNISTAVEPQRRGKQNLMFT